MNVCPNKRIEAERAGPSPGAALKLKVGQPDGDRNGSGRKVYVNGRFVPEAGAAVSIYDSALMYGDMAFEFTRTFRHAPFRLREHLERLYASLKVLRIACGMSLDEMEAATHETLQHNLRDLPREMDVQIMHDVSRGLLRVYRRTLDRKRAVAPTVIIAVCPLDAHQAEIAEAYETGVKAIIPPQHSIPSRLLDPKMKTRSRQHYKLADLMAQDVDPEAWALLADEDGFLTEGTGANFFMVKNGVLLTPEPRNILRGISRATVIALAKKLDIPCRECNLEPYDACQADEAFFTSTRFCILGISRLDGHSIGNGRPGPLTRRLLATWGETVGIDIAQQARDYAATIAQGAGRREGIGCAATKI